MAVTTESTVQADEDAYPIEDINKANALLDETLNVSFIENYYTYSSKSLFFRDLEKKSTAYAELVEMDCFYFVAAKRYNELKPIHETLSAERKKQYLVLSDLVAYFDSIYNQVVICKGWFPPPNTYDCGSFVVN